MIRTDDDLSYEALDAGECLASLYCKQPEDDNRWIFCRTPGCNHCMVARESATVHLDCFHVYIKDPAIGFERDYRSIEVRKGEHKHYVPLEQLWTAATWRYPWRQADPLSLVQQDHRHLGGSAVRSLAKWFPQVKKLPPELVLIILNKVKGHEVFRYFSILYLREKMEQNHKRSMPKSYPLNRILLWRRGCTLHVSRKCIATASLIVTIDSWGINSIDRDPAMASVPHHIYAIYEGQDISSVNLTINVRD